MKHQTEILAILSSIQSTSYSDIQSIDLLLDYGFRLTQWVAFSGEAMANANEELHKARKKAYETVQGAFKAQNKTWSPMLAKDYINDCCSKENAYYELCERCNRAATHSVDLVRTAISALKAEMQTSSFSQSS